MQTGWAHLDDVVQFTPHRLLLLRLAVRRCHGGCELLHLRVQVMCLQGGGRGEGTTSHQAQDLLLVKV